MSFNLGWLPLSAMESPLLRLDVILLMVTVAVIVVGAAVAFFFRKHKKAVIAVVAVLVFVFAGVFSVRYVEPNISYWFVAPSSTWAQHNPLTMYCENNGLMVGAFDLRFTFRNAHVSLKTSLPYELIDDSNIKFTFTLEPGKNESRQMWFIIDNNVTDFYIDLAFQQNDGNFLIRSSSGGVDSVSYQKEGENFTMRIAPLHPP